jgi:hypothetical protein
MEASIMNKASFSGYGTVDWFHPNQDYFVKTLINPQIL